MTTFNHDPALGFRESDPTYTLDAQIAEARRSMGEQRWQQLQTEWAEGERLALEEQAERIRVKYGRGSREFRRAAMRCVR